jgi:hypothetical protein
MQQSTRQIQGSRRRMIIAHHLILPLHGHWALHKLRVM